MSNNNRSVIFYNGNREKSNCGYCKKDKSSYSNGMWASSLTVQAYQELADRGWRRSGKYCYKPTMEKTCCPLYTISCNALKFELSKSQKKIIKRVTKFLKSGKQGKHSEYLNETREPQIKFDMLGIHRLDEKMEVIKTDRDNIESITSANDLINNQSATTSRTLLKSENNKLSSINELNNSKNLKISSENKIVKPGVGANPKLPKCKKKKLIRMEKKLAKNPNADIKKTLLSREKNLEDLISENDVIIDNRVHKLKVNLLRLTSSSKSFESEYAIYSHYQICIHGDSEDRCTREQFIRFLVDTPLSFEKADNPNHPGYGSFHQQYWLDDKLIAVGVLDILPKCISSVYLFYDPDYSQLVLGTYSSLREINLVRQLHHLSPELKYYYMGFYIHSCPKMRYKSKIRPSYLLCPVRYTWHKIDSCLPKLDQAKYVVFDESKDENSTNTEDSIFITWYQMLIDDNQNYLDRCLVSISYSTIFNSFNQQFSILEDGIKKSNNLKMVKIIQLAKVLILYCGKLMKYSVFKRKYDTDIENNIKEYIKLVGSNLARLLIYCVID
ncbi:arginyl-tRNA--protein transferase 1 isoform X2 [Daktulosphaira vitifoliae]|uniref:arginyl-tRNA--protein transferase 1 isoform X2 n=1 Tax=Daktulosphaira vitifoliae TaxID=58002 RepID=UPI0021AA2A57|nr:arginyl-tRNA--protein transferase 1 isoform X2 [Daktulosphaira vitifoliae]